jgi:hypothetical protein
MQHATINLEFGPTLEQSNMTQQETAQQAIHKPSRHIGGSILPSSDARILQPQKGAYGTLQVRAMPELDTHGLFLSDGQHYNAEQLLAMHPNGYSCHALANRILAAWSGDRNVSYAMEQFDYILTCGGMGRSRASIEYIASGMPPHAD